MEATTIGLIAAFCTSLSFLPQAVKVIRTKNTDALSLTTYVVFCLGVALWLVYGILLDDLPMLIANTITLFFGLIILTMKIIHSVENLKKKPVS